MNYELAKQLKNMGFPQENLIRQYMPLYEDVYIPTLSELIDACGEDFATLLNCGCDICKWNCYGSINGPHQKGYDDEDWKRPFNGKTPEEAVAKLWLVLNKK